MKSPDAETDRRLSGLLQEWKPRLVLPPGFRKTVWRAIDRAPAGKSQSVLAGVAQRIESVFRRPTFAAGYVVVLLFVGMGAGYLKALDKVEQTDLRMRALYMQSVDPYRVVRN